MKLRLIILLLAGGLLAGAAVAKPSVVSIDDLRVQEQQRQAALIITQVMEKFHYRKPRLDDKMSAEVFDRYLESLDSNRSFFSAHDIARFEQYRDALDDSLRSGKLDPAFEIFRRFRELVEQRIAYAQDLLRANKISVETALNAASNPADFQTKLSLEGEVEVEEESEKPMEELEIEDDGRF